MNINRLLTALHMIIVWCSFVFAGIGVIVSNMEGGVIYLEKKVKLKNSDASIVAFALTLVFLFIILIGLILNPGESPILGLLMFGTWFSSLIMAVIDIRKPSRKKTLSILTLIIDLGAIVLFLFVMMLTIVGMMSLL